MASGYTDGQGRFDLPLNTLPQAFLAVEVVAELDARHAPVSVVDGEGHPRVATFFYPTHVDSDVALQLVVRDGEAHRALERLALLEEAYVELATRHGDALGEILVREEAGWVSPGFCISGAGGCEDEGALSVAASYSHGPMPLVAALARYSLAKLTGASPDMSRPVDGVSGLAWTWAVGASWYIAAELRGESDFVTQTQPGVFIKHPVGGAVGWEPVGGWGSTDVQGTELEPSDVARALHRLARLSDDGASLNHLMVVLFETMARPDVSVPPDFAVFLRAWVCTPGPAADLGVEAALAEVGLIWSREDIECD